MQQIEQYGFQNTHNGKYILMGKNPWATFLKPAFWIIAAGIILGMLLDADTALIAGNFHIGKFLMEWSKGIWVILIIISPLFLLIFFGVSQNITIDFPNQTICISRKRSWGKKSADYSFPLNTILISAVRMGVSESAPHGAWIVRAGFLFEGENGEDNSISIWSKEVDKEHNIKERNEIMFELYRFFFPDRPPVTEENFITNGTVVMLLSDQEKEDFVKNANEPPRLQITGDELKRIQKKNWDKLI